MVPEDTTSSTTTTIFPETFANISEICAPSSSLIERLTAKSKSNCPAIACAKGIPFILIPTMVSTSSPISSSIISAKIYDIASILLAFTATDLHPTWTSVGLSSETTLLEYFSVDNH